MALSENTTIHRRDIVTLLDLMGEPVAPARMSAYLTILYATGVLERIDDSPLGERMRRGPNWEGWYAPVQQIRTDDRPLFERIEEHWHNDSDGIRARLRQSREQAGLSLRAAARRLGWSHRYLYRLEKRGRPARPLRLELIIILARLYRTSIDSLVGDALSEIQTHD